MTNHNIELALEFLQAQPGSAAAVLEQQPVDYVSEFLQDVPYTHAAAVLGKMLPQYAARICKNLDPSVTASFLSAMESSLVAAIIRYSEKSQKKKVLDLLPERMKIACKLLLNYSENAVGAWMVAEVATLPDDCSAGEALSRLAAEETVVNAETVYVVDRERRLQGLVKVVNLLRTSPSTPVQIVMKKPCDAISGRTALVSALNHKVWADQDTVAVTNRNNQMVGVLRHADLRKGLNDMSSTITQSSAGDPLTGLYEVYGKSLFALFRTIGDAAGADRS